MDTLGESISSVIHLQVYKCPWRVKTQWWLDVPSACLWSSVPIKKCKSEKLRNRIPHCALWWIENNLDWGAKRANLFFVSHFLLKIWMHAYFNISGYLWKWISSLCHILFSPLWAEQCDQFPSTSLCIQCDSHSLGLQCTDKLCLGAV